MSRETIIAIEDSSVQEGLTAQWHEGQLCDVRIVVGGKTLLAHRNVLAASCPYFNSMFMGLFRESTQKEIHMKEMTYEALYSIISCIYTKKITLNLDTVSEVLSAADMLQMTKIFDECKKFMTANVAKENCFVWMELFEKYDIAEGKAKADEVVLNNLIDVCNTSGFLTISKATLCSLLKNGDLKVKNEIDVFRAAKSWLEYKKERLRYASEMMKHVAFAQIPSDLLTNEVGNVEFMFKDDGCRKLLMEAFNYLGNIYAQPLYKGTVNKARGKRMLICVETGTSVMRLGHELLRIRGTGCPITCVPFYGRSMDPVKSIGVGIPFAKWSVSLVTCGNFLFLFAVDSKTLAPVAKRFDGNTENWMDLEPYCGMPRVGSATSLVGKVIVLAGGMRFEKMDTAEYRGKKITNENMVYDIEKNSWRHGKNIPEPTADAKACTHKDVMYIGNGVTSSGERADRMWAYDAITDKWMAKPKFLCGDKLLGIAPTSDRKLVAVHYSLHAVPTIQVEIFSLPANQWSLVYGPLLSREWALHGFLAFPHHSKLCFISGSRGAWMFAHYVDSEGYVTPRRSIYNAKQKEVDCYSACATLIIPV